MELCREPMVPTVPAHHRLLGITMQLRTLLGMNAGDMALHCIVILSCDVYVLDGPAQECSRQGASDAGRLMRGARAGASRGEPAREPLRVSAHEEPASGPDRARRSVRGCCPPRGPTGSMMVKSLLYQKKSM